MSESEKTQEATCDYLRVLCKSQREVIEAYSKDIDSYKEEIRQLRITLGIFDAVSMKAEEIRIRRDYYGNK